MARSAAIPTVDSGILLAVLALIGVGFAAIYSASHVDEGGAALARQIVFASAGVIGMAALARTDYRVLARYRFILYGISVLALVAVLFTPERNGAHSWWAIGRITIQPSEFGKLAVVLSFAAVLSRWGTRMATFPVLLRALVWFAPPFVLVLAQPDFGTGLVYGAIWLVMVLLSGARPWQLGLVLLAGVLLIVFAWNARLPGGRPLIKDYQKRRLDFLHADPAAGGYHQRQATIAIGAGMLFGKGYLQGTQAQGGFLPEQATDFIFAVIGEEFGLFGCLAVLALYLVLLLRLARLAEGAETPFARLIVAGVLGMWTAHVIINIGMSLTLFPVAGVPLPFVSYGGSSLLTNLLALGIVLNISRHAVMQRSWAGEEGLVQV